MSTSPEKLRVPCAYQGGKQRIAEQIVGFLLAAAERLSDDATFYDLCCGSGAITLELINRGVAPERIVMLDASSWGSFWKTIGDGTFDLRVFEEQIDSIPDDKRLVKAYMSRLAERPIGDSEPYLYPILQACSFGGKQIWREGEGWKNAFFRDYWEPTSDSVRRSPANPMQPGPRTLLKRIAKIAGRCRGLTCMRIDVMDFVNVAAPSNSVLYLDPPYQGSTGYGFGFDLGSFISAFTSKSACPLFVSEAMPLSEHSIQLVLSGAKGGISGHRSKRNPEWLSCFGPICSLE